MKKLFAILFSLTLYCVSCNVSSTKEGYELAKKNCSVCHSFPHAGLLDKTTWKNGVLPNMAKRLGVGIFGEKDYVNNPNAAIPYDEWMKIVDYYITIAPTRLEPAKAPNPIKKDWAIFELKTPRTKIYPYPLTILTTTDTANNIIYTSDGNNYLYKWNNKLELIDSILLSSGAVSAKFFPGEKQGVFSTLGSMVANDDALGQVLQFNLENKLTSPIDTIAQNLRRSVQIAPGDFNNDGLLDWIVCEFGHTKGSLSWLQQMQDGSFQKNTIVGIPGAVQVLTDDFNNDGWQDLMVLFAHDDESIRLFINNKKGSFTIKKLLSFPPVYGSTSFQLVDFNNDGLKDILYTSGDNADISKILKPYHGVYIYLNKGDFKFEPAFFYPVNGCSKAIAADFDADGDLDIVSIAFFADFKNNAAEKFLYFEQDKPLHFIPHSPPIENAGRWICMDVSDYDKDGDPDIILGNFAKYFINDKTYKPGWDMHTPMIVLENKSNTLKSLPK